MTKGTSATKELRLQGNVQRSSDTIAVPIEVIEAAKTARAEIISLGRNARRQQVSSFPSELTAMLAVVYDFAEQLAEEVLPKWEGQKPFCFFAQTFGMPGIEVNPARDAGSRYNFDPIPDQDIPEEKRKVAFIEFGDGSIIVLGYWLPFHGHGTQTGKPEDVALELWATAPWSAEMEIIFSVRELRIPVGTMVQLNTADPQCTSCKANEYFVTHGSAGHGGAVKLTA